MISNSNKSSIPFVESNQLELRPSSDSSSSSSHLKHRPNTLPRKKKESILQKFSISSRRSLSWLPGVHDAPHRQQERQAPPHPISASSGASVSSRSSADQHNHQSTKGDHHSIKKTSIGKGIRNVARTVKKSLHQFERPRSITGDHLDRLPSSHPQELKGQSSLQQQSRNLDSQTSDTETPSFPNQRTRAVSTSEVYIGSSNRSRDSRIERPDQSLDRSSPAQPFEPGRVTPSNSPQSSPKKPHPQIVVAQLESFPSTRVSNRQHHQHLSWHAQTLGSLPMAANLLAAPSPPPVDHSTFLAIIPGRKSNSMVPSLSVAPPAALQSVEPSALTAASMGVEPALSRRVSLSSSAGGGNSPDGNGFTFIRTPSSKAHPFDSSNSAPSSPSHSGMANAEWSEIAGQSTALESVKSRPPMVSMSTTISLVQSCVAERGSIHELDEIIEQEQSVGYHVAESHEELSPTVTHLESSLGHDGAKTESRKRKVTSLGGKEPSDEQTELNQTELDSSEGVVRQNKVLRSMDHPFSSSKTSTEIGMNHETSHPLSLLTVNETSSTKQLIHRLGSNHSSQPENNPRNSKHRKNSTKSKLNKNLASISNSNNHHTGPNQNRNGNEIWNLTIVSTMVGVVIIAAVLISSTNFSNLNGKSWIGNLVKKL